MKKEYIISKQTSSMTTNLPPLDKYYFFQEASLLSKCSITSHIAHDLNRALKESNKSVVGKAPTLYLKEIANSQHLGHPQSRYPQPLEY